MSTGGLLAVGSILLPAAVFALAIAVVFDGAIGEFPERVHPVAWFGRLVASIDRAWQFPRFVGLLAAIGLPVLFATVLGGLVAIGTGLDTRIGVVLAGLALSTTLSIRLLLSTTTAVIDQTTTDISRARESIVALVGRDTATLSAPELRSGAVESLAENFADGLVAPLLAFAIGAQFSLAIAVGAAAWVKAVNTLDSMLGYASKPVGWASARLDDVVMWVPARLSALLIALAARDPGALWRARSWANEPSSPNSGWPMATLAAVLDVQLQKIDAYTLNRSATLPTEGQSTRSVRLVAVASILAVVSTSLIILVQTEPPVSSGVGQWF